MATAAHEAKAENQSSISYTPGFGGQSEAISGALPKAQNNPQKCPFDLYAEQISGTAFTKPRASNQRSWLYRIRPSVLHQPFSKISSGNVQQTFDGRDSVIDPNQMRWQPIPIPEEPTDFVEGLVTYAGAGNPKMKKGLAIHYYVANSNMVNKAMQNSDGDFLIVPQIGTLVIQTEFGILEVPPREIAVIQRGIRFSVRVSGPSRGYICEVFQGHFQLPDLGPIGANGLANERDFRTPVAAFEDRDCEFTVVNKYGGLLFQAQMAHSPFDVVAWHGNYVPFKYDLSLFCTMNSVSFDHPDPSIYTVLTCPTNEPGVANCDFVIFPPRWMVMDHSFRPPYFHRNTMSEFMGMIEGSYDAKVGFVPGGASLHSCMTPHGPDSTTFQAASNAELKPEYFNGGLAFMFESTYMLSLTEAAASSPVRETEYSECWQALPKLFTPPLEVQEEQ